MENFIFNAPTKIIFGKNTISNLPEQLSLYGKNVLLTYGGGSIKKSGLYDTILTLLKDFNVYELSNIEPNPRIESVYKGIELCKNNNIDVILAVGGGSTIDCSKVIGAGYYYEKDTWDIVMDSSLITKCLPIVTVLTLAATGSEMNKTAVISNMTLNIKKGTRHECMSPKVSILDPTYTFTLPKIQTASGSSDILSHLFENYFQKDKDCDVSDRTSEGLMKTVIKCTKIALEDPTNYSARANIMWASSLALNGLTACGKSGSWSCHAIEHELSAFYDITHGVGLAIITIPWMNYVLNEDTVDIFDTYAKNVFGIKIADKYLSAKEGINQTSLFFKSIGLPSTLKEVGIDESKLMLMAKQAYKHGNMKNALVPLEIEDIYNILCNCK